MRFLKTSEAAALLSVSPNTLRAWERRFGFPRPQRSPGRHRLYTHGEIQTLRDALQEGLSISSAISRAREGLSTDTDSLTAALLTFDEERSERALEATLALRSLERSVEEVLLPSLEAIADRHGADSAQWAYAARWSAEWLRRANRLTAAPVRNVAVLIGDATDEHADIDCCAARALELFLGRSGAKVLTLSIKGVSGLQRPLEALAPDAIVLAGNGARDDEVARWAYNVRLAVGARPIALYRRSVLNPGRARTTGTGTQMLPAAPRDAAREVLELVEIGRLPQDLRKDERAVKRGRGGAETQASDEQNQAGRTRSAARKPA